MVIIELILIILGVVFMLISFRVTEKLTPKELEYLGSLSKDELRKIVEAELNKAAVDVDNRLDSIIDNSMEKVEVAMDKETNAKIMAISEYSDTVLENINRNHNEVMFLYSMLNDKHTELTEFASSLRTTDFLAQKSVKVKQNSEGEEISDGSGNAVNEVIRAHSALAANSTKGIGGGGQASAQASQAVSVQAAGAVPAQPNRTAAAQPKRTVAAQPNRTAAAQPNRTAAAQPGNLSAAQSNRTAMVQPGNLSAAQSNRTAAAQPGRTAPVKSGRAGMAQPGSAVSAQPNRAMTAQPGNHAAVRNTAPVQAVPEKKVKPAQKRPVLKASPAGTAQAVQEEQTMQTALNHNAQILKLYRDGMSETDIAKQLELGVGEVKLVIGLFKGES